MFENWILWVSQGGRCKSRPSSPAGIVHRVQLGQDVLLEDRVLLSAATDWWNRAATAGDLLGLHLAAYALRHSLQSAPRDVNLNLAGGDLDQQTARAFLSEVQNTPDLFAYVGRNIGPVAARAKPGNFSGTGSETLEFKRSTNMDLFLALHKMDRVSFRGYKYADGRWAVSVTVTKRYDFQYNDYSRSVPVAILNNAGLLSQYLGIIHPYNIQATLTFYGQGGLMWV